MYFSCLVGEMDILFYALIKLSIFQWEKLQGVRAVWFS